MAVGLALALLAGACTSGDSQTSSDGGAASEQADNGTDAADDLDRDIADGEIQSGQDDGGEDNAASPVEGNEGAASLDDPYVGSNGNGGYDVGHYDLALKWDPETSDLDGRTTITATATEDLASFNLDLYQLKVSTVTVDGDRADFERDGTELMVTPATTLAAGQRFETVIEYGGTPGDAGGELGAGSPSGWHILEDSIYVLGEPISASTFHPANDHPSDKASFTYHLTAPSDLSAVAGGTLADKADNGDGTTTWTYQQPFPMATYLTTILIGPFEVREGAPSASGVPIRNVFYTPVADEAEPIFDKQPQMIDAFEKLFGRYPFDIYGSAVVDDEVGGALETQTLSVFGSDVVRFGPFAESVVAHELAHQWFGNAVSVRRWEDLWLNEGFASYAEALWKEQSDPNFDYKKWIRDVASLGPELEAAVHRPPTNDLFGLQVYQRGALALHALRLEVGDDIFFEILQTWVKRYEGKSAGTADFEALAAELSGRDLTPLFDQWIRFEQLPAELDGVSLTASVGDDFLTLVDIREAVAEYATCLAGNGDVAYAADPAADAADVLLAEVETVAAAAPEAHGACAEILISRGVPSPPPQS